MTDFLDSNVDKLFDAVVHNKLDIVKEILSDNHAHIFSTDCDQNNPLILASLYGRFDIFIMNKIPLELWKEYVETGNQFAITPIIATCASGSYKILDILLSIYNNIVDFKLPVTKLGRTCLEIACGNGHLNIVDCIIFTELKNQFLTDSISPYPLMLAMINEHEEILKFFYLPSLIKTQKPISKEVYDEIFDINPKTIEEIPFANIDECCSKFYNFNILALAVILQKRKMFNLLMYLGADLDAKISNNEKSVRDVAEEALFYIYPNMSEIQLCETPKF